MKIRSKKITWKEKISKPDNKLTDSHLHGFFGGEELFAIIVYRDNWLVEEKERVEKEKVEEARKMINRRSPTIADNEDKDLFSGIGGLYPLDVDGEPMNESIEDFNDRITKNYYGGFSRGNENSIKRIIHEPKKCRLITSGFLGGCISEIYYDTAEEAKRAIKKVINSKMKSIVGQLKMLAVNVE